MEQIQRAAESFVVTLHPDDRPAAMMLLHEFTIRDPEEVIAEQIKRDYIDGTEPVTPEEFLDNPYYLGEWGKSLYPIWKRDLCYVLDPKKRIEEWALVGAQGTGKCGRITDLVTLWSGEVVTFGSLVGKDFLIPTLVDGKVAPGKARAELNCLESTFTVTTQFGKTVSRNAQHPFWVAKRLSNKTEDTKLGRRMKISEPSWMKLSDIRVGDLIAVPDSLPVFGTRNLPEHEVKLLAYFIGDGGTTLEASFTQTPGAQLEEFKLCVALFGCHIANPAPMQYRVTGTYYGSNPMLDFLRKHEILGKLSKNKKIPLSIFALSKAQLAIFLSRLYSTDGWAHKRPKGKGVEIGFCSASYELIKDVQKLLLRFGIHALLNKKSNSAIKGGPKFDSWTLSLSGHQDIVRFADQIGIFGKEKAVEKVASYSRNWLNSPRKRKFLKGTTIPIARPCYVHWKYRGALPGTRWEYVKSITKDTLPSMTVAIEVPETHTFLTEFYEHNSTAVLAAQTYKIYRFSRLQNPLKFFELDAVSKVYFGIFSLNKEKSSGLYDKFSAVLNQSPYFQQRFPSRRKRMFNQYGKVAKDETDLAAMVELVLPSNLRVIGGSMTQHAVSVDLMSCILDEMNWRRKKTIRPEEDANSALSLYEQVRTRITGRFVSKHQTAPGILCAISSKRATTDFMDGLTARIKKEPSRGFVSDYALWEAKPGRTFSGQKFYVFIGGSYGQSRIIPPEELEKYDLTSMSVLPIPEEFRPEFLMNITTALRDIAGVSTVPYQLLFEQEAQIRQVEDPTRRSPFFSDEVELGVNTATTLDRALDIDRLTIFDGMTRKPIMYPQSPRYIHIDLSKNKDATGITMLCPSDVRRVSSRTPDGKLAEALIPLVYVDFMIRVRAAHGDQIDYDKIRQFLVFLRRIGFRIACVSYDSFQCLAGDTLINTTRGLIPICSVVAGDTVMSRLGPKLVEKVWAFGEQSTFKITTQHGDQIEGTGKHKIEVRTSWKQAKRGEVVSTWEWKQLNEIQIGDTVNLVETPVALDSSDVSLVGDKTALGWRKGGKKSQIDAWVLPTQMTSELAEVLGLIWGDGTIQEDGVSLVVTPEEAFDAKTAFIKVFGYAPSYIKCGNNHGVLRLSSRWLVRWLAQNGLNKPFIPKAILESSRKVKAAFLKGLFATDGSVALGKGNVTLSTKWKHLARQVQILLRTEFGLGSCITTITRGYPGDYVSTGEQFVVSVRGSRESFAFQIGFTYQRKQELLLKHSKVKGRRRIFSKVAKIEPSTATVYDLQIVEDPSYIANGFVSHNSTDSMQMLSKMGFKTSAISTVRSDLPYLSLKQAFVQRRLNTYHYMPLVVELRQLIHDQEHGDVDHPDTDANGGAGSKDIADSLCGAYWSLTQAISAVKTSTKNPTTLDPSRYEISPGKVGDIVAAFFEGLKGAETPDTFVANDYLAKEKIVALNLSQKS